MPKLHQLGAALEEDPFQLKPVADRAFCEGPIDSFSTPSPTRRPRPASPLRVLCRVAFQSADHLVGAGQCLDAVHRPLPVPAPARAVRGRRLLLLWRPGPEYGAAEAYRPGPGPGYDYNVISAEALVSRMSVRDGRIVLPDRMSYRILALPDRETIDLAVLRKIAELVRAGALRSRFYSQRSSRGRIHRTGA